MMLKNYQTSWIGSHLFLSLYRVPEKTPLVCSAGQMQVPVKCSSIEMGEHRMTYCLGIMTREGLVMASDSRANAGFDQVNVCPKMHTLVRPGERAFVILTSGNLSLTPVGDHPLTRRFPPGNRPGQGRIDVCRGPRRGGLCAPRL